MFVNTDLFREAAIDFIKSGDKKQYCTAPQGTRAFYEYWQEQKKRCIEGYSVGGFRITGPHYFYLNFCQIKLLSANDGVGVVKTRKDVRKTVTFPAFWDGDYEYYHYLERVRELGQHAMILKPRRRGYSYKNASLALHQYQFYPNSNTLIGAYDWKYLKGAKGTMTMFNNYLNFIDGNTAWRKRRDEINQRTHKKASYLETNTVTGEQVYKGYMSEVQAITFKDNADAAKGNDADLVLMEEAGVWPNIKASFLATKPIVESGMYTTGQIILFGTGNKEEGIAEEFIEMFNNPEPYNINAVENIWDDDALGTKCAYFIPDYVNKDGFIDKDGNSDRIAAKKYEEEKRAHIKRTSKDPKALDLHMVEYPFNPREATLSASSNILPAAALDARSKKIETTPTLYSFGQPVDLFKAGGKVTAKPTNKHFIRKLRGEEDLESSVVIYYPPRKNELGLIADDQYFMVIDPYAQAMGTSLGACFIVARPSRYIHPKETIVAEYIARPHDQDSFNENAFLLAEYYNAKIAVENNTGNVIEFAKRTKRTNMLIEEFTMDFNKDISGTRNRIYGYHMTEQRKRQGEIYLRDWLNSVVYRDEEGVAYTIIDTILSLRFLNEAKVYNPDKGNFDAVLAMLGAMFYLKETYYKEVKEPNNVNSVLAWLDENFMDSVISEM